MADGRKEGRFLGQGAGIRYHGEGVHLQAIVIMEAQRFMLDNTLIQPEAGLLKALLAAGMAGVQDGHIVLFRYPVDRGE